MNIEITSVNPAPVKKLSGKSTNFQRTVSQAAAAADIKQSIVYIKNQ